MLKFDGNITFISNHAEGSDGGALYLLTFSQIMLSTGVHLEFVNNTGGYDIANYMWWCCVTVLVTIIG